MANDSGNSVATQKKKLTDRASKVVRATEQMYWELGLLPAYEMIAAKCGERTDYVKGVIEKNGAARKQLTAIGIDLDADSSSQLLNKDQLLAANVILNAHDTRSLREKLDLLGISSQKWHAWLRQPAFSQYMAKRAEALFDANDHAAYSALNKAVEEGGLDAVKFHFEMRGKYKQSLDININVEEVLVHVVEIIAKHVNDKDVIIAIAEDIKKLDLEEKGEQVKQAVASIAAHSEGF